jgi:MATE family multidrug resistance protein
MVDIAVVGHNYPAEILSTVAIGTTVFDVLFGLFIFLRMSTTGLTAQNPKKPVILQRALITALMIAALIIVLSPSLFRLICVLVPMNVNIKEGLFSYFHLRILATPAILINFVLMGYFFGQQNTKAPLMMLLLINLSAIVLDFVLVNYFRIGLKGLGYANILSQCFGSALGVILTHHQYKPFVKQNGELFEPSALMAFFHLNKDIFIRTLCLMISIATFTRLGAGLGPSVVAANLILMSLHQFSSYFLDGFAISCEALVGKALGRNDVKEFIAALKACFLYSILIGCALSLIYSLCSGQLKLDTFRFLFSKAAGVTSPSFVCNRSWL